MASKILVNDQANYDEVLERAIIYPVEILGCKVRGNNEVFDLNFWIR